MLTSPTREKQILTNLQYRINFKIWNHLYTNTHKKITPSILRKIKILELFEKSQQQFQLSYRQIKLINLMITWLKVSSFQDHSKKMWSSHFGHIQNSALHFMIWCASLSRRITSRLFLRATFGGRWTLKIQIEEWKPKATSIFSIL